MCNVVLMQSNAFVHMCILVCVNNNNNDFPGRIEYRLSRFDIGLFFFSLSLFCSTHWESDWQRLFIEHWQWAFAQNSMFLIAWLSNFSLPNSVVRFIHWSVNRFWNFCCILLDLWEFFIIYFSSLLANFIIDLINNLGFIDYLIATPESRQQQQNFISFWKSLCLFLSLSAYYIEIIYWLLTC